MKYISFCSGIEAATVAWHSLGWEPLAFCEIEKFPSRVLAHHYPQVPNLGDFTAVDWSQWTGKADVCVGGTPCQAFSVAGLRKSLLDERGNLSLEFIRAVNIVRPRFVVWENVPGVLSTADNAFGCFLAGLVGCEEPIVFEQGWPDAGVVDGPLRSACWRVLDAQYFGLAQRRRRVFVVASAGDGPHPAEILFEWEGLRRDSPPCREAGEGSARGVEIGPSGGGFTDINPTLDSRCKDGPIRNQLAGAVYMCLNASMGKGKNGQDVGALVASCIGVDEEQNAAVELMGCLKARKEGGGQEAFIAMPINLQIATRHNQLVDSTGFGVGDDGEPAFTLQSAHSHGVAHALRADGFDASKDGTGRGTPLVPMAVMENQRGETRLSEATDALTKGGGKPGQGYAAAMVPIAFQSNAGSFINAMKDCTPTLRIGGDGGNAMAVAWQESQTGLREYDSAGTLRSNGPGHDPVGTRIREGMAVRRLTPRECERLQGFPDDYTNIPGAADGPRYKALGNSMAVSVMRWIGKRIKEANDAR